MNTTLEQQDAYLTKVYASYADFRPEHPAPAALDDLTGGRATVFRKLFLPLLPDRKDASILDVGCGYGEFVHFLQSEGYSNAQGIDLNAQQVKAGSALGVMNLRCGDCREFLSGTNQSFDFISAIDVLEHMPKVQLLDFLGLVHAALSPGGMLLCQVPNLAAFYTPLFYMDFTHETPFTASSLKQALQIAGFSDVNLFPLEPLVHGAKSALRFVLWKGIAAGLRFVQSIEGGPRDASDSIYTAVLYATAKKA